MTQTHVTRDFASLSVASIVEEGSRHVVVLHPAARKMLHSAEYLREQVCWRTVESRFTNVQESLDSESFVLGVERFRNSVGQEQHRITWIQRKLGSFIGDAGGEQSRRNT